MDLIDSLVHLFVAGLAILVNTCCPLTQAYYAKFCNHVTAVSLFDKDLVPVTNRYALVESKLNSFMHGYVLGIPRRHDSFASSLLRPVRMLLF